MKRESNTKSYFDPSTLRSSCLQFLFIPASWLHAPQPVQDCGRTPLSNKEPHAVRCKADMGGTGTLSAMVPHRRVPASLTLLPAMATRHRRMYYQSLTPSPGIPRWNDNHQFDTSNNKGAIAAPLHRRILMEKVSYA